MKNKLIAFTAVAALAAPAGAVAHDNGKSKHAAAHAKQEQTSQSSKRCKRTPLVGFAAKGTFVSFDANTLVVNLTKANKHARNFFTRGGGTMGEETFTTDENTKFEFGEGIADGADEGEDVGFGDLQAGTTYTAKVIGKIAKPKRGCSQADSLTIKKVIISLPEPEGTETQS